MSQNSATEENLRKEVHDHEFHHQHGNWASSLEYLATKRQEKEGGKKRRLMSNNYPEIAEREVILDREIRERRNQITVRKPTIRSEQSRSDLRKSEDAERKKMAKDSKEALIAEIKSDLRPMFISLSAALLEQKHENDRMAQRISSLEEFMKEEGNKEDDHQNMVENLEEKLLEMDMELMEARNSLRIEREKAAKEKEEEEKEMLEFMDEMSNLLKYNEQKKNKITEEVEKYRENELNIKREMEEKLCDLNAEKNRFVVALDETERERDNLERKLAVTDSDFAEERKKMRMSHEKLNHTLNDVTIRCRQLAIELADKNDLLEQVNLELESEEERHKQTYKEIKEEVEKYRENELNIKREMEEKLCALNAEKNRFVVALDETERERDNLKRKQAVTESDLAEERKRMRKSHEKLNHMLNDVTVRCRQLANKLVDKNDLLDLLNLEIVSEEKRHNQTKQALRTAEEALRKHNAKESKKDETVARPAPIYCPGSCSPQYERELIVFNGQESKKDESVSRPAPIYCPGACSPQYERELIVFNGQQSNNSARPLSIVIETDNEEAFNRMPDLNAQQARQVQYLEEI